MSVRRPRATGNPGCLAWIQQGAKEQGIPVRICHPVELLDEAYDKCVEIVETLLFSSRKEGTLRASGTENAEGLKLMVRET